MYLSKMLFKSLRELPSDIELESHKIMLKSSMIHQAGSGIYTYQPTAWKSLKKIESIIRQEMDAIGGQELRMPVIQPKDIWSKSGRFEAMGDELFKLLDRRKKPFVLAPTHEEILTLIVKDIISSYKSLPQVLYQIQTKLRDEPRPRGGLLRVREFVMKDAYSFDINQEGLDENYNKFSTAYHNIYERCGLEVIKIEADSGAIGGKDSHEFVAISDSGEDTVVLCTNCDYAANTEKAIFTKTEFTDNSIIAQLSLPDMKIPIAYGLGFPDRIESFSESLNLEKISQLNFIKPDDQKFPSLNLARQALSAGGTSTTLLNAANEMAVEAFLNKVIDFTQIMEIIALVMDTIEIKTVKEIEGIYEADILARELAKKKINFLNN